ncbi:lysozyme inhibitor LprI family protein [Thalassotalea atypica]|uniref:lysozyme inhibitor LprI family protein n=1 Tax=Thalassotalea atypica TaxID=2054316 RepID=UPI0025740099|nr:lysozyme inhibitor LprI family protein [Thalassotalea atypica]
MRKVINSSLLPLIVLGSALAVKPVYAASTIDDCQPKAQDSAEYSRCLDVVIDKVDREMQTWINNQIFILEELAMNTGRNSALKMFKRSQSNFIRFREDNCRWQYLALSPNEFAAPAYKKCYIRASQDRIKELEVLNSNI